MINSKPPDNAAPGNAIVASIQTDVGCVRTSNQDCGRFLRPTDTEQRERKGVLAVVADGMGGHSGGEVASSLAVEVICRAYYASNSSPVEALTESLNQANREIHEASSRDEKLKGMGTTCTALAIYGNQAVVAHVGDSRLYLLREGEIYLMTEDHSAVMEMVKQGLLSLEDARHHEDKNVILRALGTAPNVDVSTWKAPLTIHIGDQFILCSDGLYDLVADSEIKDIVSATADIHSSCEQLINLAKKRGGYDNITVGILTAEVANTTGRAVRETREFEVVT